MTPQQIEALKLALDALETLMIEHGSIYEKAIAALKKQLAQPEQEPACPECKATVLYECVACSSNNYPPQRTEQEPTPEIKYKMIVIDDLHPQGIPVEQWVNPPQRTEPPQKKVWTFWDLSGGDITDAIKAKLKEKNNG